MCYNFNLWIFQKINKYIFVFLNQDEEDSNDASDADVVIESEEQIH